MGATSSHFSEKELACHCCSVNACLPELVAALEQFRVVVGMPVSVHDAYRCEAHNMTVGGALKSQHLLGKAADISVAGMTAADLEKAAKRCSLIKGIGRSDKGNYLHIDTRQNPAQWCYGEDGKQCKYYPPQS